MNHAVEARSYRARTLKALDRLPTLSPMMTQLLARLARRNCELSDIVSIIEKDAMLTAQVLRLANSALFGRKQPVVSVRHALLMIGVGTIRKFALGSSISNLFSRSRPAQSFSMTRFNLHSVATATLAELLAEELPVEHGDEAFIAGLLHDVGTLLTAVNMPQEFEAILTMASLNGGPILDCEREILGADHAELSELVVTRWELAEPIRRAARYHHCPDEGSRVERTPPGRVGLSLLIHKADAFVNLLGMSIHPGGVLPEETPSLDFPGFNFSAERTLVRFEKEWRALGEAFG